MLNTASNSNVACYFTFLPTEEKIWLERSCRREKGPRIGGCWVNLVLSFRVLIILSGKGQFSKGGFVFPSFPFYGCVCWSSEAIVLSLCGTRSGSDGRLPTSHQTFSQSFSSTGQPRGPLEPPQIIKPWSLSCLRPAPPLRPSAALGYKEVILLYMV